jgi:DNA-binding Lrp family transcriptional regulator
LEVIVRRFAAESDLPKRVEEVLERVLTAQVSGLETPPDNEDRSVSFGNLAQDAKVDAALLGVAFANVSSRKVIEQMKKLIERGVTVRILMPNPELFRSHEPIRIALETSLDRRTNIAEEMLAALKEFKKLSSSLTADRRKRFHVRMHSALPTMNLKMVDAATGSGKMLLEVFPYRCGFPGRLRVRLSSVKGPKAWYDALRSSFETMWNEATEILPTDASGG